MIWAILALLGVPLWLRALGILVVVTRSRRLRARHGNIPVRCQRPGTPTVAAAPDDLAALLGPFSPNPATSAA